MNNKKQTPLRKKGHRLLCGFLRIFVRRPKFIYLGERVEEQSIILSNHVGKLAPLKFELYFDRPFRFWGTHEMNEGLIPLYKYQSKIFYHQKQHWNLFLARVACLVVSPLTYLFYKGLNLISTYRDHRFKNSIEESINTLQDKNNIIIFPEDSSEGYFDKLKMFYSGFMLLAQACYKMGMDLPIFVTYYKKEENVFIVDKPVKYSELIKDGDDRDTIANMLCDRANELRDVKVD